MTDHSIIFLIFLIFSGAAVFATAALYARQALTVAYIGVGILFGPSVLGWVPDPALIADIANIGIIFLLFLLGLNLELKELHKLFSEAVMVTGLSSAFFAAIGYWIAWLGGFDTADSVLIAVAMMFSSTIIGLKLLPTSALHHQHMGEVIVSILLLQDMLAITALLLLEGLAKGGNPVTEVALLALLLPTLFGVAYYLSRYTLLKLISKFDQIKEYIFLLAIGWCMGIAELAQFLGLSHEIGAFVAGVTLAANPIARYIAESLKPLRDFFLVMFFFALGAGFDLVLFQQVWMPACALALAMMIAKPWTFKVLLKQEKEKEKLAGEIGVRLGQISEFALLIVIVATQIELMSERAANVVQAATILTFIASSYWIVQRYPTPIASDPKLRRD